MTPVAIQTLIVSTNGAPSVVVLRPMEDSPENGRIRIVPIWIGLHEASQLGLALENTRFARPMTHDLFLDATTNLDAVIDHVIINKVQGSTFFSQLVLKQYGRLIPLDARPSDAIALAIRQKAPIYIEESVLDQASLPYVVKKSNTAKATEKEIADFRDFVATLAPEDFGA